MCKRNLSVNFLSKDLYNIINILIYSEQKLHPGNLYLYEE